MAKKKELDPFSMPFGEDEETIDDVVGQLNDPNRVDLSAHDPGEIGAGLEAVGTPYDGTNPKHTYGRPSAPKIWANAQLHPAVEQLRVWKVVNGQSVLCGYISSEANEEEFIEHFFDHMPKPGDGQTSFRVRPINRDGNEVREEVTLPPISENHTLIKKIREQRALAGLPIPGAPVPQSSKLEEIIIQRLQSVESKAEAERQRALEDQRLQSEERVRMLERMASTQEAFTERLLRQEAARNEHSTQFMATMFTQMQMMQQQAAEREREAYLRRIEDEERRRDRERDELERRREREREEFERKFQIEREEAERRREREREEAERRQREVEAERQRQHEQRMREMDLEREREREHSERMAQMVFQREKGESLEGMLERGAKLLAMVGMKPADVLEKLTSSGQMEEAEGKTNMADVLAALLPKVVEVLPKVMQRAQQPAPVNPQGYAPVPPMLPNYPQAPQGQAPQAVYAQPAAPQAAPVEAEQPAGTVRSSLPLDVQKRVRNAARNLVKTLKGVPKEDWPDRVWAAVAAEPSILDYCQELTIRSVLEEAGGTPDFVNEFLNHEALSSIPDSIPRG